MKDSYKCYEKVLIVIVTAIVLCFSVHVRASGVGNKESAQEIVNEYFSLIGNDWDKFAELYTNEQINSFKNFLENEKNIREYVGLLNVRKAKLIESIEIKYDDVKDRNHPDIRIMLNSLQYPLCQNRCPHQLNSHLLFQHRTDEVLWYDSHNQSHRYHIIWTVT